MAKNRIKALPDPISIQRNDNILIEGYRNISLKVLGRPREFSPAILVAVLKKNFRLVESEKNV